jgi:hypothetical protein
MAFSCTRYKGYLSNNPPNSRTAGCHQGRGRKKSLDDVSLSAVLVQIHHVFIDALTQGFFSFVRYATRRASTIFMREARNAGSMPPMKPMTSENAMACRTLRTVRVNLNANSEKV